MSLAGLCIRFGTMPAPPGWTAQQRLEAKDEGYWLLQQEALAEQNALAAALAEQDALAADLAEQNALAAATSAEALVVNGAEDEVSQDALQGEEWGGGREGLGL